MNSENIKTLNTPVSRPDTKRTWGALFGKYCSPSAVGINAYGTKKGGLRKWSPNQKIGLQGKSWGNEKTSNQNDVGQGEIQRLVKMPRGYRCPSLSVYMGGSRSTMNDQKGWSFVRGCAEE